MKIILIALALGLAGCTDPDATRVAAQKMGFTDVQAGGYSWFGCGDDYTFHTKFTAKNLRGWTVDGVACCGFLKGCSLKF